MQLLGHSGYCHISWDYDACISVRIQVSTCLALLISSSQKAQASYLPPSLAKVLFPIRLAPWMIIPGAGCFRAVVILCHWIIQCQILNLNRVFKMSACGREHAHTCTHDHIFSQLWDDALWTSLGVILGLPQCLSLDSYYLRMLPLTLTLPILASPRVLIGHKANKIWPGNNVQQC